MRKKANQKDPNQGLLEQLSKIHVLHLSPFFKDNDFANLKNITNFVEFDIV
jgi:hypothetical protein